MKRSEAFCIFPLTLQLLVLLKAGDLSVNNISLFFNIKQDRISHALQILRKRGFVSYNHAEQKHLYFLTKEGNKLLSDFLNSLH